MTLPYRDGHFRKARGSRAHLVLVLVILLVVSCAPSPPVGELNVIPYADPTATVLPVMPAARSGVMPGLTGGSEARRSVESDPLPESPAVLLESGSELLAADVLLSEVPAETAPTELPTFDATTYYVQPGDTLLGIAFEYGVPLAALQLANNLGDSFLIRAGQDLAIPAPRDWAQASRFWIVYLVSAGETLGAVANRYGLSLADLEAANPGLNVDRISIGQALVLPLDGPAELIAAANRPRQVTTASQPPVQAAAPVAAPAPAGDAAPAGPDAPSEAPAPPQAPPASAAVPPDVTGLPAEIFRLVNEQRAAYNLPPLAWNETLARAAQRHANDCQARGWCSHTGSDGSSYKQRIIREGYDPVRWSECWAWYGTAVRAVAMWMDEVPPNDPHRRTILNPDLTEVGVGVVPGNGFGYYFIANFGKPR